MKSTRFYSAFFLFFFSASALFAQGSACLAEDDVSTLTKQNVKAFIEETTDITAGTSQGLSTEKINAYLDRHLDKKARFKSVMKYHIPGMPSQEVGFSLGKDEFMESVQKGAESTQDYETVVEIKDIKIASNGKKAFVKTRNTEYATMAVPTDTGGSEAVPTDTGGSEAVPMEGVSECMQILSLNKGIIQMYSANCVTNIQFMEY